MQFDNADPGNGGQRGAPSATADLLAKRERARNSKRRQRASKTVRKVNKYPGLQADVFTLFERRATTDDPVLKIADLYKEFPEVGQAILSYHVHQLHKKRKIAKNMGGGWKVRTAPAPNAKPNLPAVQPEAKVAKRASQRATVLPSVGAGKTSYLGRQLESMIPRMMNANENGQLFTQIDFEVLQRLANDLP